MKSKTDRKVNHSIRQFNRGLYKDVFKDRFWIRQYQKSRFNGMDYYLFELIDRKDPTRNKIIEHWVDKYDFERVVFWEMNNFIVSSDFWEEYRKINPVEK